MDYNPMDAYYGCTNPMLGYGDPIGNCKVSNRYGTTEYNLIIPGTVKTFSNPIMPSKIADWEITGGYSSEGIITRKARIFYGGTKSEFITGFGYIGDLENPSGYHDSEHGYYNGKYNASNQYEIICSDGILYSDYQKYIDDEENEYLENGD